MNNISEIDLYDLLGIKQTASDTEIKKAYRKKALTCHPDKNPDNPRAAELFLELSKALEILIDSSARSAYDKVLKAKAAAKLRHQELDDRRKKFKEELEARERLAQERSNKYRSFDSKTAEEKLNEEIERLRKDGSKQLEEEIQYIKEQIKLEKQHGYPTDLSQYRLKIRWHSNKGDKDNGGYNNSTLRTIFSKYGQINALIISQKKKGSALLEFENIDSAINAQKLEKGYQSNPLIVSWLSGEPERLSRSSCFEFSNNLKNTTHSSDQKTNLFPSFADPGSHMRDSKSNLYSKPFHQQSRDASDLDFEAQVLQKMREAEEKKRQEMPKNTVEDQ